ncbi:type VI secretion system protein ImpM [Paraburkholderia sp. BL23I1N1]|uniref:type VI secretion system-associated protein TagF n=1 Tax=Paraburkholderia sp. BL23I1N1 TaxID=1938802 RepID=UPI000E73A204|nr:type VI secretion system-associated protein TagF [Paraburkholderia sp. BL23I1N1]RKE36303.1 type VI secretion system protein ImpM [Paraburkholderia sp. BL23I1N1]
MKPDDLAGAGFYGKVRTHGDFVGRGLSAGFVALWDAWLQRGLVAARERYAEDWLNRYLAMPVWCFAARRGVVAEDAHTGVLMPGIDAVGRYFPFVIAQPVDGDACVSASSWHADAAELALSTLKPDFSLTEFETSLTTLRAQSSGIAPRKADSVWWCDAGEIVHRHDGPFDAALFLRLLEGD